MFWLMHHSLEPCFGGFHEPEDIFCIKLLCYFGPFCCCFLTCIHAMNFSFRYLIGCDNLLAKLHTKHPELCDKVGGLLAMHIDDLRALAPMWLSKTEEVREDRAHWATNLTGDIYGKGWISEMYGYSFGAAEVSWFEFLC